MPGLLGSQQQLPTTSKNNQQTYNDLLSWINGAGIQGLNPSVNPNSPENQAFLKPYMDLFATQNARTLAQAKESAGNLTGSGLGNTIGARAGEAAAGENAFLSNLLEQHNQTSASRYASLILGALGSPAGQVQNYYQPGIMDYLLQGAGNVATAAAGAGAFGGGK